ncbi:MAG TPA: hypothetical protein VMU41_00050 [Candidatus Binataceae bacterium]|nr:hypothetical protein [Candidatus Binataceae bacterium]
MPKLLLFVPCDKVIVDETTHSISIVDVLQELHYKLPPGVSVQPKSLLPVKWAALSLWQEEEPADSGLEFEQRLSVENQSGDVLLLNETKWKFEKPNHRIVANAMGLPVARRLVLKLSYRVIGMPNWLPAGSFPIELFQDVL